MTPDGTEDEEEYTDPAWLPALIRMADHENSWPSYVEAIYRAFRDTMISTQPKLHDLWVRCRRDPIAQSKEAGFWHCVSVGENERDREPDLRRCERVKWIRAILDNDSDPEVDTWQNERRGEKRVLVWFREEFLIVLALRIRPRDGFKYYQLITAYCTTQQHTIRKLRRDRETNREREVGNG